MACRVVRLTSLKSVALLKCISKWLRLSVYFLFIGTWLVALQIEGRLARGELPTDTQTVEYRDSYVKTDNFYPYIKSSTADLSNSTRHRASPDQESHDEEVPEHPTTESCARSARVSRVKAFLVAIVLALLSVTAIQAYSRTKGDGSGVDSGPRDARIMTLRKYLPDAERLAVAIGTKTAKDLVDSATRKLDLAQEMLSKSSILSYVEGDGVRFERTISSAVKSFSMLHDAARARTLELVMGVTPVASLTSWATEAAGLAPQFDFLQACKACLKTMEDVTKTLYYRAVEVPEDVPEGEVLGGEKDIYLLRLASVHLEFLEQIQTSLERFTAAAEKLRKDMLYSSKMIFAIEARGTQRRKEAQIELNGQLVMALHEARMMRRHGMNDVRRDMKRSQEILSELTTLSMQYTSVTSALEDTDDIRALQDYAIQARNYEKKMDETMILLWESAKEREHFSILFEKGSYRLEACLLKLAEDAYEEGQMQLGTIQELGRQLDVMVDDTFGDPEHISDDEHFIRTEEVRQAKLLLMEFELLKFLEEDMANSFYAISKAKVHVHADGSTVRRAIHDIKAAFPSHLQAAKHSQTLLMLADAAASMRRNAMHLQLLEYNGKRVAARRHNNIHR